MDCHPDTVRIGNGYRRITLTLQTIFLSLVILITLFYQRRLFKTSPVFLWSITLLWFSFVLFIILVCAVKTIPHIWINKVPIVNSNLYLIRSLYANPLFSVVQHLDLSASLDYVRHFIEQRFSKDLLYGTERQALFVNDTITRIAHQLASATGWWEFRNVNTALTEFVYFLCDLRDLRKLSETPLVIPDTLTHIANKIASGNCKKYLVDCRVNINTPLADTIDILDQWINPRISPFRVGVAVFVVIGCICLVLNYFGF